MSFSCNGCGGELIGSGDAGYCGECSVAMNEGYEEAEARWFASCRKCMECANAFGPDPGDKCDAYDMPLSMVARKKKCKRFKEIDWSLEQNHPY